MGKPKFLYHASSKKNIKLLKPQARTVRGKNEGPVVFATPNKAYATTFLVPSDDSWTRIGRFGKVYFKVIEDRARYKSLDKGGSIYVLPSDTFEYNPKIPRKAWVI